MKCPICQAKLLPVGGELFCLQCGNAVPLGTEDMSDAPTLEETTDPLLQRAIVDAVHHEVHFRLPVAAAPPPKPVASFSSMRAVLASPRPVVAGGSMAIAQTQAQPQTSVPSKIGMDNLNLLSGQGRPSLSLHPVSKRHPAFYWAPISVTWMLGAAVFAMFVAVNAGLYLYLSSHVFPGVKVGTEAVGGESLSSLRHRLSKLVSRPTLRVQVGDVKSSFSDLGQADMERLEREVRDMGRNTPLPIAGVVRTILSRPVAVHYAFSEDAMTGALTELSRRVSHSPSDAVPMIIGTEVSVIAEKEGGTLDANKAAAAIREAYGQKPVVTLEISRLQPHLTAAMYQADIADAKARMALSLQVKVKSASFSPTSLQIGTWLVFGDPGKGVLVDGAKVSEYVSSLPGNFDRAAATNALIEALRSKQGVVHIASIKNAVAAPKLASIAQALPLHTYTYCTQAPNESDTALLNTNAATVLNDPAGWSRGGRLRFVQGSGNDCAFTLRLASPAEAATLGNELVINSISWHVAPTTWPGTPEPYRTELINHEVGSWLGLDHF